ncbi:LamG domain-containing protein [Paenibacillus sp. P25]|nr:LamG domain-containing protein [Paenibacillus sp. P25]
MMRKKVLPVLLIVFMLCMGTIPAPFAVHAASALAGYWNLDEGGGTTANDLSGQGHAGTLTGGAAWSTGVTGTHGTLLNGTNQYVDIPASVVDTTQSYSVTAWVKLNKISGFQTAVSMDGDQGSAFYLQLRGDTGKFAFTGLNTDTSGAAGTFASSVAAPAANTWYHLAGVYDNAAKTVSLYVNGTLQETVPYTTAWKANGHTAIGRAKYNAGLVDYFGGQIDDVRIYNGVIDVSAIQSMAQSAYWKLDEGSGSAAKDATGFGHNGTPLNGAQWTAGQIGTSGVQLNGSGQNVEISGPVVDTTQSYSVSAWVKPDKIANYQTAVSIDGSQGGAFYLQLRGDTGKFAFTGLNADQANAAGTFASAGSAPAAGTWYHLAGVYDAGAKTLSLYVNGALQQTVPYTLAWKASGNAEIGRGKFNAAPADYWSGAIDDVHLYPYALDASRVIALSSAGSWSFDESSGAVAADQSPNGVNGNISGASRSTGRFNNGLSFDGDSSFVGMGSADALNFGKDSFTLAGWFKSTGTGWRRMLSKGHYGWTNGYLLQNSVGAADGHVGAGIGANGSQNDSILFYTNQTFNDGNWHHAAAGF